MNELLEAPFSPSPKLQWLAKRGLHTALDELPRGFIAPADKPWRCSNAARTVNTFADTEEEAILLWCSQMGVRHWTVEQHIPLGVAEIAEGLRVKHEQMLADSLQAAIAATSPQQEQGIDFDE